MKCVSGGRGNNKNISGTQKIGCISGFEFQYGTKVGFTD